MSQDAVRVEIDVEDPGTGQVHTFSGANDTEAEAAAAAFFGVNEAQERDDD